MMVLPPVLVLAVFVLPARSDTFPALMDAVTVPSPVIPLTLILNVVPLKGVTSVITAVVAPAIPVRVTSSGVKLIKLIGSLKVALKLTGLILVGSACPTAFSTLMAGGAVSNVNKVGYVVFSLIFQTSGKTQLVKEFCFFIKRVVSGVPLLVSLSPDRVES